MIKKGSNVKILTGKDKNKTGEVIEVDNNNYRVKIKGANIIKKHIKTTKDKKGGIFEKENFIHASNVVVLKNEKKKESTKQKWYLDWKNFIKMRSNYLWKRNMVLKTLICLLK